jgi:hypothetical protein
VDGGRRRRPDPERAHGHAQPALVDRCGGAELELVARGCVGAESVLASAFERLDRARADDAAQHELSNARASVARAGGIAADGGTTTICSHNLLLARHLRGEQWNAVRAAHLELEYWHELGHRHRSSSDLVWWWRETIFRHSERAQARWRAYAHALAPAAGLSLARIAAARNVCHGATDHRADATSRNSPLGSYRSWWTIQQGHPAMSPSRSTLATLRLRIRQA